MADMDNRKIFTNPLDRAYSPFFAQKTSLIMKGDDLNGDEFKFISSMG